MKTLIIGLGNPIMGDDAIGCICARELERALKNHKTADIEVDQFYRGGISLMERLIGYDRVLIIDSIAGYGKEPGTIVRLTINDLPSLTTGSPHDSSLKNALEFGSQLGAQLPTKIDILAIEIKSSFEFSERLTPPVGASIPKVIDLAFEWLNTEG
jgi:hydrogenase maturation protease